tara:strand:- start:683 stop:1261 length:579 start_codon:yes stop_codon:yes gene_type:complete
LSPILGIIASQNYVRTPPSVLAYDSIATSVVGAGGVSTVTFSSIPSTYKHLQIRCINRDTTSTYQSNDLYMNFNGDTASNYSFHRLYGTGASVAADSGATQTYMLVGQQATNLSGASMFGANVIDIFEYTNTSIYKTSRSLGGVDLNGNTDGRMMLQSGNWRNTAAITSITFRATTGNLAQYSHFALYGIKG